MSIKSIFISLAIYFRDIFVIVGKYVVMQCEMIVLLCTRRPRLDTVLPQLYDVGVRSLPLISLTGMCIGMVLAAQSFFQLSDKGLTGTTGIMVAKSMLVEIGPMLTAFVMAGRIGAAMCAEIGSMKVTEQLDAMTSLGINPLEYMLVPRYLGMGCMMPLLTLLSTACGIFGGWFLATRLYGMQTLSFFDPLPLYISWFDILINVIKSCVFGLLIVSISCFYGLNTQGGASGVGHATTKSVVVSYTCILLADIIITIFLNSMYWYIFGFK